MKLLIFSIIVSILIGSWLRKPKKKAKTNFLSKKNAHTKLEPVSDDFVWHMADPYKPLHFKDAAYRLTMGIKSLNIQDWLLIEPTYRKVIDTKTKIIKNIHPDYPKEKDLTESTVFLTNEAVPAVHEFYSTILDYICTKYPKYFKKKGNQIHNLITDDLIPANIDNSLDARKYLFYLARTIEEDFIILLKDPSREHEKDGTEYFFKAGVFAFAAGFDPKERFNKPLSFIHHPIPGYEEKLKVSMNRFFERIQPGQFVTRNNFSVQNHDKYYVDDANKGHNLPEGAEQFPLHFKDLDFNTKVHYRSERQVLTKLPKSGAVIFTIRTYLLPMSEIKSQGREVCDRLIGAIKGFPEEIAYYKRSKEWGHAVIEYLSQP